MRSLVPEYGALKPEPQKGRIRGTSPGPGQSFEGSKLIEIGF
jgi:hypothetical protein